MERRALLLAAMLAFTSGLGATENLLTNQGFDRDLRGWIVKTRQFPAAAAGALESSAMWSSEDVGGSSSSGSVAVHAFAQSSSTAGEATLEQCVPVEPGSLLSYGARVKTVLQMGTTAQVLVANYRSGDCSGEPVSIARVASLPISYPFFSSSSHGAWLVAASKVLTGEARSTMVQLRADATGSRIAPGVLLDALLDDAFLTSEPAEVSTWLVPSATYLQLSGESGSVWMSDLTLTNPGPVEAAVTLKFLGHDSDGRAGVERFVGVPAGSVVSNLDLLFPPSPTYGAILVSSSRPELLVSSETSCLRVGAGTVGDSLPATAPSDLVRGAPKAISPIREDERLRTNLVMANATELPNVVRVRLRGSDGAVIGTQEVPLRPLEMTQLNHVVSVFAASSLTTGWLELWTDTPGGAFAAYASVIDNLSNDPKAVLPR